MMMDSDLVSSSPAFGSPAHPLRKNKSNHLTARTSILPILLPPSTLRPVAFRTFTRKHNLTISSSALQTLATFVGRNCGSGWREEGLAERVLDEVAKSWKKAGGGVIIEEGKGASLKTILQTIEGNMSGGRVIIGKAATPDDVSLRVLNQYRGRAHLDIQLSPCAATTLEDREQGDSDLPAHPRSWIKVVDAFDIPRLTYNADKKYFEAAKSKPSLFPQPCHKTALFRDRYNVIYQRLLRNESFQVTLGSSSVALLSRPSSSFAANQCYKLTPIANLLGRSGTSHLLLGMLSVSPTGDLSLTDLTGSIALELSHARMIPEDGAWFAPGMIVLIDGIYEEEETMKGSTLGGNSGIGGAIGGRFVGVSICGPPCERRDLSLGTNKQNAAEVSSSGGFGWVDFLGVGSERAQGHRMRQIQAKCLRDLHGGKDGSRRTKIAIMGEVNLDHVKTLDALKRLFGLYSDLSLGERPTVFILIGNFVQKVMINGGGQAGGIEYKEYFDSLAMILSEFPSLLQRSTFIFVPGDNDPWSSAFSAGAAATIPRQAVPELFTSRVKRAFATANAESDRSQTSEPMGEAIWTTNPSHITLFGPVHDIAIVRDDISGRLRRNAISIGQDMDNFTAIDDATGNQKDIASPGSLTEARTPRIGAESYSVSSAVHMSRKLVKTILDQGTMSPFPLSLRPILWDYASSLQLYPLPSSFILADPEAAPFCMTYEGCHVMNPGRLIPEGDLSSVRWVEYDVFRNRGRVRETHY
ncbi:DNA polymerase epsilon noncatalytic subunit [Aspergillus alliaceus]|uniref:DNA polymerase epsilon noncatalytic subunit n=1 Tax=Petromyces alliaceus TaxID=209559 RepID=UPI0012A56A43|nr:DNA polymerase alpha/epsilon subunit B-domain-containing protein [Aspergillus alliaceus]KAB8230556.1 DNA polymerase alpha/epsilon subunit B-domain-containing protein [Aspergillus alliaceus]